MARTSKATFDAYYKTLPTDLQALHMFFRASTEYHQAHRSDASARVRRQARSELEARVFTGIGPQPMTRRCERILAVDRAVRIARIHERRHHNAGAVLRLDLKFGGGNVVPFAAPRKSAVPDAATA